MSAVLVGLFLGLAVVAGAWSAPWWSGVLHLHAPSGTGSEPTTGTLGPCQGSTCLQPAQLSGKLRRLAVLVAGERAAAGCQPIHLDSRLQRAAQEHADTLATGGQPSHLDERQRSPQDRAEAAGYRGRVQENLAVGLDTADAVMKLWLDDAIDPSLRTRLDNCAAVAFGTGYSSRKASDAYGAGTWVLLLGQRENA